MSVYYQNALRQMDLARSEKIRQARENEAAFYAAHPELDRLTSDIAAVSREAFNAASSGAMTAEDAARFAETRIRALREKQNDQIRAFGVDPDSFVPKWDCPYCEDTGYRRTADGNREMCACLKRLAAHLMIDSDDFRPNAEMTFAAFDLSRFPQNPDPVPGEKHSQYDLMDSVRSVAENYAEAFSPKGSPNFILIGESGLGKTFLAQCIANAVQQKGFTVCSLTAFRLSALMKDAYLNSDGGPGYMDELFLHADLLLIDDLGSEPIRRNINLESLFSILNERSLEKRPTIVVTNLMPIQLRDRYGERITSRLFSERNISIRLYGADVRRNVKS